MKYLDQDCIDHEVLLLQHVRTHFLSTHSSEITYGKTDAKFWKWPTYSAASEIFCLWAVPLLGLPTLRNVSVSFTAV